MDGRAKSAGGISVSQKKVGLQWVGKNKLSITIVQKWGWFNNLKKKKVK